MKKALWIAVLCLVLAGSGLAADSITAETLTINSWMSCKVYTWTAASDGSVTSRAAGDAIDGMVVYAITDPGATAPTADYDVLLVTSDGVDVMGDTGTAASPTYDGALANLSATATETARPMVNGLDASVPVRGNLTLVITNNSADSATGTVKVFYLK